MHRKPAVSLTRSMETQSLPTGPTRSEDDIRPMLSICERYLRIGDYAACQRVAIKAQISNLHHPGPCQFMAMCAVLAAASSSTALPDWYSILQLPKFSEDQKAIKENFGLLSDLLNPKKNPFPMAAKAQEWLLKAWAILSEPSMKALFDRELRMEEKAKKNVETFWTKCPKCCYFYEYERMYKGRFMRCQNVKCRAAFKAKPMSDSASPLAELVNGKVNVCSGIAPSEPRSEREGGKPGWTWRASRNLSACSRDKDNIIGEEGLKKENGESFVGFSGKGKRKFGVGPEVEDGGCAGVVNGEGVKVEEVLKKKKGDGFVDFLGKGKQEKGGVRTKPEDGGCYGGANGEGVSVGKENNGAGCEKVVKKRKKMMARTSKKVAGRGISVNMNELFSEMSDYESDLELEGHGDSKDNVIGVDGLKKENGESFVGFSDMGKRKFGVGPEVEDRGCAGVVNGEGVKVEEVLKMKRGDGFVDFLGKGKRENGGVRTEAEDGEYYGGVNGEEVSVGEENNGAGGEKVVKKRKKMMARTSKKVAGRGISINMNELFSEMSDNESDLELKGHGDSKAFDSDGITKEKAVSNEGGFSFLMEDDDVFAGLETDFDLRYENIWGL